MNLPIVPYYPTYSGGLVRFEPKPTTYWYRYYKHQQCDLVIFEPFCYFICVLKVLPRNLTHLKTDLIKYSDNVIITSIASKCNLIKLELFGPVLI